MTPDQEAALLELKGLIMVGFHGGDGQRALEIVQRMIEGRDPLDAVEIAVSSVVYNEVRTALVTRGVGGVILERPLPRRIEMTGITIVESVFGKNAPDWPPQASAIGLPEGHRRFGSTGQLWEVKAGRWERVLTP